MRVIAGKYKGRRIESPKDNSIRPTTDKVKEAMFSILYEEIYGSTVIDLFAGTGGLGIEALSRGADRCYFGDSSKEALSLMKYNLDHCKIGRNEGAYVMPGSYRKVLGTLADMGVQADIILLDPPYRDGLYEDCFGAIAEFDLLSPEGIIVAEHSTDDTLEEGYSGFAKVKERKYGQVKLSLYRNAGETEKVQED